MSISLIHPYNQSDKNTNKKLILQSKTHLQQKDEHVGLLSFKKKPKCSHCLLQKIEFLLGSITFLSEKNITFISTLLYYDFSYCC